MIALLVTGGVIGAVGVSIQWHKVVSRFAAAALTEIAVDARQIHGGKADATLERKTQAMPSLVQQLNAVHQRYLTDSEYNHALWAVARFHEDIETVVPASIQSIMQLIPPRPKTSCELSGTCPVPTVKDGDADQTPSGDVLKAAPEE